MSDLLSITPRVEEGRVVLSMAAAMQDVSLTVRLDPDAAQRLGLALLRLADDAR